MIETDSNHATNSADHGSCAVAVCSAGSWLFPEIEAEIREERSASAREAAQRVREEKRRAIAWLRGKNVTKVIDKLVDRGPMTEAAMLDRTERAEDCVLALGALWALWRIGKLWRVSKGIHPGAGEETFLYGIRGVHKQNTEGLASTAGSGKSKL